MWDKEWDWNKYENTKDIKHDEWKHVEWFHKNCNWRRAVFGKCIGVTSASHGIAIGGASNPCETLYILLKELRERTKMGTRTGGWEEEYMKIVNTREGVKRKKGVKVMEEPKIVGWPEKM